MITTEDWWNVLINFNESIMPFQFIWAGIALILTIWFFIKPGKINAILLKVYFMLSFAFISIMFFAIKGQDLPAFVSQAICFGSLAILFTIDLKLNKLQIILPEKLAPKIVMMISVVLVFLYPIIGMLSGHIYPRMIILGTFPCPTVALAIIFATASLSKAEIKWQSIGLLAIWILLLIWAIPFPIAIQIPQFGAYEDIVMLLIGIYGLVSLIWTIVKKSLKMREEKQLLRSEETITKS